MPTLRRQSRSKLSGSPGNLPQCNPGHYFSPTPPPGKVSDRGWCHPCQEGLNYMEQRNRESQCTACTRCRAEEQLVPCTVTSDAKCRCPDGYSYKEGDKCVPLLGNMTATVSGVSVTMAASSMIGVRIYAPASASAQLRTTDSAVLTPPELVDANVQLLTGKLFPTIGVVFVVCLAIVVILKRSRAAASTAQAWKCCRAGTCTGMWTAMPCAVPRDCDLKKASHTLPGQPKETGGVLDRSSAWPIEPCDDDPRDCSPVTADLGTLWPSSHEPAVDVRGSSSNVHSTLHGMTNADESSPLMSS